MYIKLFLILLLIIPTANAWKAETHKNIIEYVYLNLPEEVQAKLNLTILKEGSIAPDRDFKDFRNHHYPASLNKAELWLDNDTDLSYNLGVASHYIADSFVAPHNIKGEKYSDHSKFESQVSYYYPSIKCKDYNFSLEDLKIGAKNSKDWNIWLKTKNSNIPKREVDEATKFLFSIVLKKLNTTCSTLQTETIEKPYINKTKIIIISLVIIMGLLLIKIT